MVRIELDPEHLELLAELVDGQLAELRAELRRTDNHNFRERLKERQALLAELGSLLGRHRPTGVSTGP